MSEQEIIEKLLEGDAKFKELWAEHRRLDDIVRGLEQKTALSLDEEAEVKRLKKIKLSLKDQIELKIRETGK
ncbi:MAG: YdcH family protein [Deltaproteobacteria bacterium]